MTEILTPKHIILKSNSFDCRRINETKINFMFRNEFKTPSPSLSPKDIESALLKEDVDNEKSFGKIGEFQSSESSEDSKFIPRSFNLPMQRGLMLKNKLEKSIESKRQELESLREMLKKMDTLKTDINDVENLAIKNILRKLLKQNYIDRYNEYLKHYKELSTEINEKINDRMSPENSRQVRTTPITAKLNKRKSDITDYFIVLTIVSNYDFITDESKIANHEQIDELFTEMDNYQRKIDNIYFLLKTNLNSAKELTYELRSLKNYYDILTKEIKFIQDLQNELLGC